ncbi:MAG: shikimate dehydrogenase family protein [Saprospiraceae bacterium]
MRQFGLIGFPLTHSFSKSFFTDKIENEKIPDANYEVFPLEKIEDFLYLTKALSNLGGLNVTTPHKEAVMEYLDHIDPLAKAVGAVNVVKFEMGKALDTIQIYMVLNIP